MSQSLHDQFFLIDIESLAQVHISTNVPIAKTVRRSNVDGMLEKLEPHYDWANPEIRAFLTRNNFLFQPLFQAAEQIQKYFGVGTQKVRLDLLQEGSFVQLFALIPTSLGHEVALKKLAEFDKKWWFNVPPQIHDYLEFTLEFV